MTKFILYNNEIYNSQQVGFFKVTYKTKHIVGFFTRTYKTKQYRGVLPFARSQKSEHKYIVSKGLSGFETFLSNYQVLAWVVIRMSQVEKIETLIGERSGYQTLKSSCFRSFFFFFQITCFRFQYVEFEFFTPSLFTTSLNFFKSIGTVFNLPTSKSFTSVFKLFKLVGTKAKLRQPQLRQILKNMPRQKLTANNLKQTLFLQQRLKN